MNNNEQPSVHVHSTVTMSESDLRRIVQETVKETLTSLGVDHKDPFEMQRDFQYLREWRRSSAAIQRKGMLVLVGIFCSGLVAMVWAGFKDKLTGG